MNEDFLELLEKIIDELDAYALEQLVNSLSRQQISKYKSEISEAYMSIYYYWHYELSCNKISEGDEAAFIYDMLDLLDSAEAVNPELMRYSERGHCYEMLADYSQEASQQIAYYQKAIDIYREAVKYQEFTKLHADIASALLEQMSLAQQFDRKTFNEVVALYNKAYTSYSEQVLRSFLYGCFNILKRSLTYRTTHPFQQKHRYICKKRQTHLSDLVK